MASDVGEPLRKQVARRAGFRCEDCLIHEKDSGFRHQMDHIISRKHGGESTIENLAYACLICNRNKGADIAALDPETGTVVALFHPRRDLWRDHFQFDGEMIRPMSQTGAATVKLLRLNAPERLAERKLFRQLGSYSPTD